MTGIVTTLILAAITAAGIYAGYWAFTRRNTTAMRGNPGADPHSLSADSGDVIQSR
ncbi:MAG: hypothetical protein JNN20_17740 [Betaproteobacteria bacterium]|nr:hypothetical protein [Betaproteobacteria bacterium]